MTLQEELELWQSVAKVFDDSLTQIRVQAETALVCLSDLTTENFQVGGDRIAREALAKILRIIGPPATEVMGELIREHS